MPKRRRRAEANTLSDADLSIIRCMQKDARGSLTKVAETIGMPESTVRHRLGRLVQQGLIEFAVVTNPLLIGYSVWVIFEIEVQPSRIRPVAQRLAEIAEIHLVGIVAGRYDIYAGALFRNNKELLDFITGPLARVPGIIRISTSSMIEIVKRTVTFGIPNGATSRTAASSRRRRRTDATGSAAAESRRGRRADG